MSGKQLDVYNPYDNRMDDYSIIDIIDGISRRDDTPEFCPVCILRTFVLGWCHYQYGLVVDITPDWRYGKLGCRLTGDRTHYVAGKSDDSDIYSQLNAYIKSPRYEHGNLLGYDFEY